MSGDGMEIKGSGPDYWKGTDLKTYRETTKMLGQNPEYFTRFNKPMVERAKKKFRTPIHLLDIACGPADELTFFKDDPEVRLIATDISTDVLLKMAKPNLGQNAVVFDMDVNKPPIIHADSVECGILMNAMIYVPDKMLKAMFAALRPGAECTVNFILPDEMFPWASTKRISSDGIKLYDKELRVAERPQPFKVRVIDYSQSVTAEGKPDLEKRPAGEQIFFHSVDQAEELIRLTGFEIIEHAIFNTTLPKINLIEPKHVFVLKKPDVR